MIINHNLNSMNAHRNMTFNTAQTGKAMEKLSSGLRINRAGDDAAGLAISEKMRGQIRGLDQATRNAQDGISLIQTAEGGLNETHSILQRMRELTVQSQNDTNTDDDRGALNKEFQALKSEITRIGDNTKFNTKNLLNGDVDTSVASVGTNLSSANGIVNITSNGAKAANDYVLEVDGTNVTLSSVSQSLSETVTISAATGFDTKELAFGSLGVNVTVNSALQDISDENTFAIAAGTGSISLKIGANNSSGDSLTLSIGDMTSAGLGLTGSIETKANADIALNQLDVAIKSVSDERANLGAFQNRLEHTINNLSTSAENLQAAESRIRDVDMAKEMMNFTKNNILNQAAQAMMAQSNQQPQAVLQLLR